MLFWSLLWALLCCAPGAPGVPQPVRMCRSLSYAHVALAGDTLCFKGMIKPDDELVHLLKTAKVSALVVNSPGGYAAPALDAALLMQQKGVDIYVDGVCGSSCANYLFLAARHKIVPEHSIVLWHGSPRGNTAMKRIPPGWSEADVRAVNARLRKTHAKQAALFALNGVNQDLLDTAGPAFFHNPVVMDKGWTVDDIQSDSMQGRFAWTVGPVRLRKDYGVKGIRRMWYPDAKTLYAFGKTIYGQGFALIALPEPEAENPTP